MTILYFLEAAKPLTKHYTVDTVSPYPIVKNFKSHKEEISTIEAFKKALEKHAAEGHCLIKGQLLRDLDWEDRRKATSSTTKTQWVCLDLDAAPFKTPEDLMSNYPALVDVSYITQWSASAGIAGKEGLRCHIFFLLDKEFNVNFLKSWLMSLNLDGKLFKGVIRTSGALRLNDAATTLHYPIDITCCQNDKLIYIAPPVVAKEVRYTPPKPAIELVIKKLPSLPTNRLTIDKIEDQRNEARKLINALRKEKNLPALRNTRMVKGVEVQGRPGELVITGVKSDGEFVRLNFNGGDSWAYWHPVTQFEIIHSFKGEPSLITSEVAPGYYQDCMARKLEDAALPTQEGEVILGICDKRNASLVKVAWNPSTKHLQLYPAKNDGQLRDWLLQHNKLPGDFTPQWDFEFNPQNHTVLDVEKQYINTYVPSVYRRDFKAPKHKPRNDEFPVISKVITSMVSNNKWNEITEHLMNWLACIFQFGMKTRTAWVLHGIEGTGKGMFFDKIMKPLIGSQYVKEVTISRLEDGFNGWLERTLLCFVDELQVSASQHRKIISGTLRNWITEPALDMRNMNQVAYNAQNYTNFIIGSNKKDMVEIDDTDRRYNIGEFQATKLIMTDDEVAQIKNELQAFFNYLMVYKADREQAGQVIHTQSRKDVILANRNSVDMLADALLNGDMGPFVEVLPDIQHISTVSGSNSALAMSYHTIVMRELNALVKSVPQANGMHLIESKLSRDELFILFEYCIGGMPQSPSKFTRMLKHKKVETARMRSDAGSLIYGTKVNWTASSEWCMEFLPPETSKPLKRVK